MNSPDKALPYAIGGGKSLLIESGHICESGYQIIEKVILDIFYSSKHSEFCTPVFTAIRELIQNATKACLKRIIFEEKHINPESHDEYNSGIKLFNQIIHSEDVQPYRAKLLSYKKNFNLRLDYLNGGLIVQVEDGFLLYPQEEMNIRKKFDSIHSSINLLDFYKLHSDVTEGAGMGIALIYILLKNSGISPRNFSIFNNRARKSTISRIIIPLEDHFISPREEFKTLQSSLNLEASELRKKIRCGEMKLKSLPA